MGCCLSTQCPRCSEAQAAPASPALHAAHLVAHSLLSLLCRCCRGGGRQPRLAPSSVAAGHCHACAARHGWRRVRRVVRGVIHRRRRCISGQLLARAQRGRRRPSPGVPLATAAGHGRRAAGRASWRAAAAAQHAAGPARPGQQGHDTVTHLQVGALQRSPCRPSATLFPPCTTLVASLCPALWPACPTSMVEPCAEQCLGPGGRPMRLPHLATPPRPCGLQPRHEHAAHERRKRPGPAAVKQPPRRRYVQTLPRWVCVGWRWAHCGRGIAE